MPWREAAPIAISCVTSTSNDLTQAGVCSPPPAFFDPAGGLQSYSWTFYQSREQLTGDLGLYWQYLNPIYTFQIFGVPDPALGDFTLYVHDNVESASTFTGSFRYDPNGDLIDRSVCADIRWRLVRVVHRVG